MGNNQDTPEGSSRIFQETDRPAIGVQYGDRWINPTNRAVWLYTQHGWVQLA